MTDDRRFLEDLGSGVGDGCIAIEIMTCASW